MVCVNVRSHIRAPACTRLHPLTPTCTRSHISHACGCADVRIFAHPHFHTHFQKFFCKTKLRQPHHARCTHFARVRVCGRAKFRTSALSHTYPKFFLQKKTLAATPCTLHTFCTRAGVRTCEISHIRTFTHISKNFFAKKNSDSHTVVVNFFDQALFTLHEPWYKQTCVHRYEVSTKSKILVQKQSQPIVFQFVNLGGSIQ